MAVVSALFVSVLVVVLPFSSKILLGTVAVAVVMVVGVGLIKQLEIAASQNATSR